MLNRRQKIRGAPALRGVHDLLKAGDAWQRGAGVRGSRPRGLRIPPLLIAGIRFTVGSKKTQEIEGKQ